MTVFIDAVKRYSGYARFVAPMWSAYVAWVGAHPKTAAVVIAVAVPLALV